MKPNINIVGVNLRQYEFGIHKCKEQNGGKQRSGKSLEYRQYFNTKKSSIDKSALDLWHYCDWIGKEPTELIQEYMSARKSYGRLQDWQRETKNSIIRFYQEQKAKGYKINMARNSVTGVMAFYSKNCEQIKGITKELDPVQIPDNEFAFDQETLRKLYYYGNLFEKTWLSCAVSLGYASVDFLALETEKIANLAREAKDKHLDFIMFMGKSRVKTSTQPRSFLTPECIENLSEYLKVLEKQNNGKLPQLLWNGATNDNLNDWLKSLVKKSNIDTYGREVRFHSIRKFVYDTLSMMSETIACVITAKKTDASKITYKPKLDAECLRIFKESYKFIALNGDASGKGHLEELEKIKTLENTLTSLEKENASLKTRLELMQRSIGLSEEALADLLKPLVPLVLKELRDKKNIRIGTCHSVQREPTSRDIIKEYLEYKTMLESDLDYNFTEQEKLSTFLEGKKPLSTAERTQARDKRNRAIDDKIYAESCKRDNLKAVETMLAPEIQQ
jgi:hypothetical protein